MAQTVHSTFMSPVCRALGQTLGRNGELKGVSKTRWLRMESNRCHVALTTFEPCHPGRGISSVQSQLSVCRDAGGCPGPTLTPLLHLPVPSTALSWHLLCA